MKTPGPTFFRPGVTICVASYGNSDDQSPNRTRQGYARKRILKPAGRFFSGCSAVEWGGA